MKKYQIIKDDFKIEDDMKVYRIQALKDCGYNVKAGDLGGYIESEDNLSQEGNCWVAENAIVCENAKISENAFISGDAIVSGHAKVFGNVIVLDHVEIFGNAKVYGDSVLIGYAKIYGKAKIYDKSRIGDHVNIFGNAIVHGFNILGGVDFIGDNADVKEMWDVMTLSGLDMIHDTITFYKTKTGICLTYGEYIGITIDEFQEKVTAAYYRELYDPELVYCAKEFLMICDLAEYHFEKRGEMQNEIKRTKR